MDTINDMAVRLAIVGLGGFGENNVYQHATRCDPAKFPGRYLFVANTDRSLIGDQFPEKPEGHMAKWKEEGRLTTMVLGQDKVPGRKRIWGGAEKPAARKKIWGAGTKVEVGAAAAKAQLEEIKLYLQEHADVVLLLAGMGKGTGQGAAPVVAELLVEKLKIPVIGMAVTPFMNNGEEMADQASAGLHELRKYVPTVVFQNQKIKGHPKFKHLSKRNSLIEFNQICIMGPLVMISALMQRPGNVDNIDLADLMRVCEDGNTATIGYWEEPVEHTTFDPEQVVSLLVEEQFQDPKIIKHCKKAILTFEGSFTVDETEDVKKAMMDRMESGKTLIIDGTHDPEIPNTPRSIGFFAATSWDNLALEQQSGANTSVKATHSSVRSTMPSGPTTHDTPSAQVNVARQAKVITVTVDGVERTLFPPAQDYTEYVELEKVEVPTDQQVHEMLTLQERISRLCLHSKGAKFDLPAQYVAAAAQLQGADGNGHKKGWFGLFGGHQPPSHDLKG